ncbi:unnamed protein product, partial [Didymodactylos carnosus]
VSENVVPVTATTPTGQENSIHRGVPEQNWAGFANYQRLGLNDNLVMTAGSLQAEFPPGDYTIDELLIKHMNNRIPMTEPVYAEANVTKAWRFRPKRFTVVCVSGELLGVAT